MSDKSPRKANAKKKPALTLKEKRSAKKAKDAVHPIISITGH